MRTTYLNTACASHGIVVADRWFACSPFPAIVRESLPGAPGPRAPAQSGIRRPGRALLRETLGGSGGDTRAVACVDPTSAQLRPTPTWTRSGARRAPAHRPAAPRCDPRPPRTGERGAEAPPHTSHGTAQPHRRAARSREKCSSGTRLLRHPAPARPRTCRRLPTKLLRPGRQTP